MGKIEEVEMFRVVEGYNEDSLVWRKYVLKIFRISSRKVGSQVVKEFIGEVCFEYMIDIQQIIKGDRIFVGYCKLVC